MFTGTNGTLGFVSKWLRNKQVGSGEQEIKLLYKIKQ